MDALFNTLSYVLWVALALGILVFVHELGHFLAARLFGMRVDAFSLGFPPNVVTKQVGETEYRLGAIPLGGYVSIAGMVDESLDVPYEMERVVDDAGQPVLDDDGEPLWTEKLDARGRPIPHESEPSPDEYRSKPVWQRVVVISAGVIFNFVLAAVIWSALAFTYGRSYTPAENVRLEVTDGSIAADMGLETGDRIVAVNGEEVERFEDVFTPSAIGGGSLTLTVLRDGQRTEVQSSSGLMTRLSQRQRELEAADEEISLRTVFGAIPLYPALLANVAPGSPAEEAGLQGGDQVVAINGQPIRSWFALTQAVEASAGEPLTVRWARPDSLAPPADGVTVAGRRRAATLYEAEVTPRPSGDRYVLGVVVDEAALDQRIETLGLGASIERGTEMAISNTAAYFSFVGLLVSGQESVRENVGGPLMIAKQSKEAADRGAQSFWSFVAILSIALAVFNVLPIPALDGGHLVFLAYEGIVRREPSLKVRMVVQQVGVALILMLMVFVIFNDAVRWFG